MGIPPPQVIQPMNSYPWFSLKDFSVWGFLEQKNVGYSFPPFVFGEIIIKANFIITFLFVFVSPWDVRILKTQISDPSSLLAFQSLAAWRGGREEERKPGEMEERKEIRNSLTGSSVYTKHFVFVFSPFLPNNLSNIFS